MILNPVVIPDKEYKLSGTLIIPDNTSTRLPAVVFYHGMPSKSKPRYVERAKRLAQQGIAALCFDFRGCGESDGKLEECSIADWIEDALLAFDYLTNQPFVDKERLGIAGKSFGGYTGALVSEKRDVKSMVFHAPAVFKDEWFNKKFQWTPEFKNERIAYRHTDESFNNKAIRAIEKYINPLLIIASELDVMCPKPIVEKYFSAAASKKKKLVTIQGADHPLTNEKHNEEYTKMLVDWFKETL